MITSWSRGWSQCVCVCVFSKQTRLLWRWRPTTATPRERWFSGSRYETTTQPGNWSLWLGLTLQNSAGNKTKPIEVLDDQKKKKKSQMISDTPTDIINRTVCVAEMLYAPFLTRCAWWTLWTRAIRLTCPSWSVRIWEWRSPNCTAGLSHTTASVCSWTQTRWWETDLTPAENIHNLDFDTIQATWHKTLSWNTWIAFFFTSLH